MRENASAPRVSTEVYIKSNICSLQGLVLVWGTQWQGQLYSQGAPTGVQGGAERLSHPHPTWFCMALEVRMVWFWLYGNALLWHTDPLAVCMQACDPRPGD